MHKIYIAIFCCLAALLNACSKDNSPAALPNGSVSFQYDKDTLEMALPILTDSVIVVGIKAELTGHSSNADHWVKFAVDTTKISAFRERYGNAVLLPGACYNFFKPMTRISGGGAILDSAELNLVQQTKLEGYSTYVLPIVIQSVDRNVEGAAATEVLYYVLKTGRPASISKVGWTIAEVSSVYASFAAANVLDDNNLSTFWASNINLQMPQWVTINFNKDVTFSALNYYLPTALGYPNSGGYPTSIRIETSMDGSTWVNRGEYAGNIANNMQTLNTGIITGRYLRFKALACAKYLGAYEAILISGISLVP